MPATVDLAPKGVLFWGSIVLGSMLCWGIAIGVAYLIVRYFNG